MLQHHDLIKNVIPGMIILFTTVACSFEMLLPKQNNSLEKMVNTYKCICLLNPSSVLSRKRTVTSVHPFLSGASSPYAPLIGVDRYRYVWCGKPRKASKRGITASLKWHSELRVTSHLCINWHVAEEDCTGLGMSLSEWDSCLRG